jgi:hypothetical protein
MVARMSIERELDSRPIVGWCLCAVKNVSDEDPFWVGYVPVTWHSGSQFWFIKPLFRNRPRPHGPTAYHFKLLTDFYIEGADEPDAIEHTFPKGAFHD